VLHYKTEANLDIILSLKVFLVLVVVLLIFIGSFPALISIGLRGWTLRYLAGRPAQKCQVHI